MRRLLSAALLVLSACPSGRHSPASVTPAACVTPVREPVLSSDMVQDLGTLQVGTDATFMVTTGTSSFFIFSQEVENSAVDEIVVIDNGKPVSIPNAVVPTNVISPGGTLYYDDLAPWPTVQLGAYSYPDVTGVLGYDLSFTPVSEAFPVPNTSAALVRTASGIEPGVWKFTVNDWARECVSTSGCTGGSTSGRYRVHVVTRPGPIPDAGTLDLEVYLATDPAGVLSTSAAAAVDPQVVRWVQGIGHFLGNAGISLGDVTFHDLTPDVKNQYAPNGSVNITDGGPCGDLSQLFTAAIEPRRAVHIFLAEEIIDSTDSGNFVAVGVDGSIPGPSGFPGTIYGGAIVGLFGEFGFGACTGDTSLTNCGTDRLAYVAAHEIGHWLGLYHPTERFGTLFDPIADTDRCPCYSCALAAQRNKCAEVSSSPTTVVTNDVCTVSTSCGGGRNLMFWLLDENISTGELSRDQGQIVRLNPAVR